MIVMPVQSKKYGLHYIFIDGEDFDKIKGYTWGISKYNELDSFRATTSICVNGKQKKISMQSLIIKRPEGMIIDHKDRNPLNNTKNNLRICTQKHNRMNSKKRSGAKYSEYKGVSFNKRCSKYFSTIGVNNKRIFLGNFDLEIDAAKAYNESALIYYKEYAVLNVIK